MTIYSIVFYSILNLLISPNFSSESKNTSTTPTKYVFTNPPPFVIPAKTKHTATLIFLHGFTDTEIFWSRKLDKIRQPYMKLVCPVADTITVTLDNDAKIPSWLDRKNKNRYLDEDIEGIRKSSAYIKHLIDEEIKSGIPPERIVVGGFDQGGAIALHAALTYHKKLGAIIGIATWLPFYNTDTEYIAAEHRNIPILLSHGKMDENVIYNYGYYTTTRLQNITDKLDFKTYSRGRHEVTVEGFADIQSFLKSHIHDI